MVQHLRYCTISVLQGTGEKCPVFLRDQTDRAVEAEERAGKAGTGMSQLKYRVSTPWMWVTQHTYQSSS